jgi:hypothetical protein
MTILLCDGEYDTMNRECSRKHPELPCDEIVSTPPFSMQFFSPAIDPLQNPGIGRAVTDPIAIYDFPLIQGLAPFSCGTQIQTFSIGDKGFSRLWHRDQPLERMHQT